MKANRIPYTALALLGSAMMFSTHAEKVRFESLPTELRDKIKIHSGAAAIEDVDRQTKGGKTTYEVAFKKNGAHTEMLFDDRGQFINPSGTSALDSRKIQYSEVPEAVRKIVDARLKGAEINDVDRQVKNGQANYEIGFKQNGQQQELVVSQDGRITSDANLPDSALGASAASATGVSRSSAARGRMAEPVALSSGQKVEMKQLPEAVQKAITTAANGARVEDLERGTWRGQNVYQAGFKESGKHVELQVRENGVILHDPRDPRAAESDGRISWGEASPEYASVKSLVPLSSGEKVERTSLPSGVQRRLRTHINTPVEDIERGTWQGKTIYQVGFKDENGKHRELQIDDKGNIVYDPRTKR